MSVTLEQIAEETGIDKSTISKILLGKARKARISREREAYVHSVAEKHNFRPNAAARAMSRGRFGCVAMILSGDQIARSNLPGWLLAGVDTELAKHGIHLTLSHLPDTKLTSEAYLPKILQESMADGLLVNYNENAPPAMEDLITRYRLPTVWLNAKRDGACVFPDDFGAARKLTEHLLGQGYRRVAFLDVSHGYATQTQSHYSVMDRKAGYEAAMSAAGLVPRTIWGPSHIPMGERLTFTKSWLLSLDRPDAVVAYGQDSLEMVFPLAMVSGLSLPRELAMATFADVAQFVGDIRIATMVVNSGEVGIQAVRMLLKRISDPSAPVQACAVPFLFHDATSPLPV